MATAAVRIKLDGALITQRILNSPVTEKVMRKSVADTLREPLKQVVQSHYRQALRNVQQATAQGLGSRGTTRAGMKRLLFLSPDGKRFQVAVNFRPLKPKTLRDKQKRPGRDRFWKDTGKLGAALGSIPAPSVRSSVRPGSVVDNNRLRYTVSLNPTALPAPLDELIRSSLITGIPAGVGNRTDSQQLLKVFWLEEGTQRMPSRPFIATMSARLGRRMLQQIDKL